MSNSKNPRKLTDLELFFGLEIPSFLFATLSVKLLLPLDFQSFCDMG
jgi:hypothetical protein